MRKAEAAVCWCRRGWRSGLLVKDFFDGPMEAVLQRMAGRGGRRPATADEAARGAARRARAAGTAGGGRAPPPSRTLPAVCRR